MKFLLIILFTSLAFTGCYTVLWTPDQGFPTESTYYGGGSVGYDGSDGYYTDPYYGGYEYYYEYPWWLSMAPPTISNVESSREQERTDRSNEIRNLRNEESGKTEETRLKPPTRSSVSDSGNTGTSTTTTDNNSDRSSGTTKSEDRNKTRSSGDRNSGGGRR